MSNDVIASNISTIAGLNAAIVTADGEGASATPYEIDLAPGANIALTSQLQAINLQTGVTLDIAGDGATLNGETDQRGLFVYSGVVDISDLTIENAAAVGGNGGAGAGGGAGLGGGLFVAGSGDPSQQATPNVTLTNVSFANDAAQGGDGGSGSFFPDNSQAYGGGGGMGGAGGSAEYFDQGGGGGGGGIGGNGQQTDSGPLVGIVHGAPGGGGGGGSNIGVGGPGVTGGSVAGGGGGNGSGGGGGGGGGVGGGLGGPGYTGGNGGFGGGGGASDDTGGNGGFGGGGGGNEGGGGGNGGFGGGHGGRASGPGFTWGGGGGLGAGGDIFVQAGATLTIASTSGQGGVSLSGGSVARGAAGAGAVAGDAFGGGIFLQGGENLNFTPAAGTTQTISDVIADENGSITSGFGADKGSLTLDGAGTLVLGAVNTYTGGTTIDSGTLLIDGSTASSAVTVDNGGTLSGTGTAGAVTVESGGTFAPGDPSTFTVASLTLNSGASFDEEIGGAAPGTGGASGYDQTVVKSGGTISLGGATLNASLVDSFAPSTGETFIIINNETGNPVSGAFNGLPQGAAFALDGDYFTISYDGGSNNQDVTLTDIGTSPCYCPGTLIRTPCGNKRVEKIQIGDEVMTAAGLARPIKWIGRRSYNGRFVMGRKDILPVCIKAGALADNVPRRDLWISPNHAMYFEDNLDGVLIEAKDLVNGVSIVQAERVDEVEYFHIELDTHDVLIAEGALSESFIDDDSRGMFHNAHEYRVLYPAAATITRYCAPRLDEGYEVEAIRQGLAVRAGLESSNEAAQVGNLRGHVDRVMPHIIEGWAQNADHPEAPVCLDIYAGGRLIGQVLANRYREDLQHAGMGSGRHSFAFTPPAGLVFTLDAIEVQRSLDGEVLPATAQVKRIRTSIAA
jgi:hypothetical protein